MNTLQKFIVLLVTSLFSVFVYAGTLTPQDADIVAAIHKKFDGDNSVAASKLYVTSHDGMVEIMGNLDSATEARELIKEAMSVDKVRDVYVKRLSLKKPGLSNDDILSAKVEGALLRDDVYSDNSNNLQAEVKKGRVTLIGTADNQKQIDAAIKSAKSVKGVKSVKSKLTVK